MRQNFAGKTPPIFYNIWDPVLSTRQKKKSCQRTQRNGHQAENEEGVLDVRITRKETVDDTFSGYKAKFLLFVVELLPYIFNSHRTMETLRHVFCHLSSDYCWSLRLVTLVKSDALSPFCPMVGGGW